MVATLSDLQRVHSGAFSGIRVCSTGDRGPRCGTQATAMPITFRRCGLATCYTIPRVLQRLRAVEGGYQGLASRGPKPSRHIIETEKSRGVAVEDIFDLRIRQSQRHRCNFERAERLVSHEA
jgi:hypothetical protein